MNRKMANESRLKIIHDVRFELATPRSKPSRRIHSALYGTAMPRSTIRNAKAVAAIHLSGVWKNTGRRNLIAEPEKLARGIRWGLKKVFLSSLIQILNQKIKSKILKNISQVPIFTARHDGWKKAFCKVSIRVDMIM